ncbi:MAG TPA: hypothetical protein VJ801_10985 [Polyangia bacterium]|jgi:hypothetical protein|nr:hypothetical protein [Polyangia bacterium]
MTSSSASAADSIQLSLKGDDVRLLLQSLDHCLATCTKKGASGKDAPCEDCDRAKNLRQRLSKLISP